jgi:hypothetical protein
MTPAERQKRRRQRERDNLRVWPIETNEALTAEALIVSGFLEEHEAQNFGSCCKALSRVVRIWTTQTLEKFRDA